MAKTVEIRMLLVHPQKPLKLLEAPRISIPGKRSISILAMKWRRQRRAQTPQQALRRARPQDWVVHPESSENSSSSREFLITMHLPTGVTRDDFEFLMSRLPVERWLFLNPSAGFAFCECSTKLAAEEALEALNGFPVDEGSAITAFLGSNDAREQKSIESTDGSTAAEGQLWKHRSQTTKGRPPKLWKKMIVRERFGDWEQFGAADSDAAQDPNRSLQDSDTNTVPQLWERQSGMISNSSTNRGTWDRRSTRFMSMTLQDSDISTAPQAWQSGLAGSAGPAQDPNKSLQDSDMNTVPQLWEHQSHQSGMISTNSTNHGTWDQRSNRFISMALQDSDISTAPQAWERRNSRIASEDSNINTAPQAWERQSLNTSTSPEAWDTRYMNMPLHDSDINSAPQTWEHQSSMASDCRTWERSKCLEAHITETWEQAPKPRRVNRKEFWKKHNVDTIYWRVNRNPQPEGKFYGPWKPPQVVKLEDYQHLSKYAGIPELMVNGKPYRRSPTRRLFEMADRCPELWTNVAFPPIWKINFKESASSCSSERGPKLWELWRPACTTNAPLGIFRELRSQIYYYYRERHRRFPTWKMKPDEIKKYPKHKEELLQYIQTKVGPFVQDLSFERLPWEKSHKWKDPKKLQRRLKLYDTSK